MDKKYRLFKIICDKCANEYGLLVEENIEPGDIGRCPICGSEFINISELDEEEESE